MNENRVQASTFAIDVDWQVSRATMTVLSERSEAKVTYYGDGGSRFRVIFRQKSNPIGFAARLPGDLPGGK